MTATDGECPQCPAKCRTRSESEDSGVQLTVPIQKDGQKTRKSRPKKLKSEKCDRENEQNSSNSQTESKDGLRKKRSKTIIKDLEDVANLLLNSDRRKIAIPVKLIERLVFVPNFSRDESLEAAQASLNEMIQGLENIRGALIVDNEQARHLDRIRTMIDPSDSISFNVLIEMKSDQQVDAAVTKLASRSNGSKTIKMARLLKEDGADAEPSPVEEEAVEPRRQRSNTISSITPVRTPLMAINKLMSKRHSLGGHNGHAMPNAPLNLPASSSSRTSLSSSSLIRLPIGPGSCGFRPEARLRHADLCL